MTNEKIDKAKATRFSLWLFSIDTLQYSTFTIDWVEYCEFFYNDNLSDSDPVSWGDWLGDVEYQASNVLEIMNPDLPDCRLFQAIVDIAHSEQGYVTHADLFPS